MKAKLILKKHNDCYSLNDYSEPSKGYPLVIAHSDDENFRYKLSKQNCDEIFGVFDVEKLAEECSIDWEGEVMESIVGVYKEGFNKAMELNKDKVFTEEDMRKAYFDGYNDKEENKFFNPSKSIQQPTEIEVEIVMEDVMYTSNMPKEGEQRPSQRPKLDENGCLILTKK